jgi:hypothetical protein
MHHDTCAVARYMRAIFRRPTEQLKRGFDACVHGEKNTAGYGEITDN